MEDGERRILRAVENISGKWKLRVIYSFREDESLRFTDIRERITNISNKVLSDTLSELAESDLIKKKESERYSVTKKGIELKKVLEPLGKWSLTYSNTENNILIVEKDMDQATLYSKWLDSFETETCRPEEIFDSIEGKSLIVMDRGMERNLESVLDRLKTMNISVIMVTGVEPNLDIIDLEIQNYLLKPINREELQTAVNNSLALRTGPEYERKLDALKSKREALRRKYSDEDLEKEERYQRLLEEIRKLE